MLGRRFLEFLLFPPVAISRPRLERVLRCRTVLITGASFGIGEALARIVARAGARVILVARTTDKLEALAGELRAAGGLAEVLPADLTDPAAAAALIDTLEARGLGPDIVVSNAGKSIRRSVFASLDRFHDITRTIGLNYLAPAQLALAAIPGLIERRGQFINVSAANVLLLPAPQWGAYQASKTAFDQWLRCAAPELRGRGLRVTTVYLPLVRTRMIEPTAAYVQMPAMSPEGAAWRIAAAMISRRRWWRPWWLPPAQLASALLRWPWEVLAAQLERRAAR